MSLKSLYRAGVPPRVRGYAWKLRNAGPGAVAREYVARRKLAAGRPGAVARAWGFRFAVDLRDVGVGYPLYVEREVGGAEIRAFARLLRPEDVVLDVGANIGVMSCAAGQLVGPGGRVVAVEPDPDNFALLAENARRNAVPAVEPVQAAAAAGPGIARLFRSAENYGDHRLYDGIGGEGRSAVEIAVTTLDALVPEGADLIKVDIQGYEHSALLGAAGVLSNPRLRAVLTEFWPLGMEAAGGDPAAYFALLEGTGLRPGFLNPDGTSTPASHSEVLARVAAKYRPDEPDGAFVNLLFERA